MKTYDQNSSLKVQESIILPQDRSTPEIYGATVTCYRTLPASHSAHCGESSQDEVCTFLHRVTSSHFQSNSAHGDCHLYTDVLDGEVGPHPGTKSQILEETVSVGSKLQKCLWWC